MRWLAGSVKVGNLSIGDPLVTRRNVSASHGIIIRAELDWHGEKTRIPF